jgi:hypothetical protein
VMSDTDLQVMNVLGWTRWYAPTPSGLALSPSSDSGVKGDDITNVTTPVITGAGEVDATLTLYDSYSSLGIVTGAPPAAPTIVGTTTVTP